MLRADELTVVHHDDSVSLFTDVRYTLGRSGLHVVLATGEEIVFPARGPDHPCRRRRRHGRRTAYAIAA